MSGDVVFGGWGVRVWLHYLMKYEGNAKTQRRQALCGKRS